MSRSKRERQAQLNCARKVKRSSLGGAVAALTHLMERDAKRGEYHSMHLYRCPVCDTIHIGHRISTTPLQMSVTTKFETPLEASEVTDAL